MDIVRRRIGTPVLLLMLFACLLLLSADRASAVRGQVVDAADFFKPDTQDQAAQIIRDVKQRFGKDVMVETYPAIPAELEPAFRAKGKERFYSDWSDQRFRALGVNGIYVLITRNPGRVQVAVGNVTQQQAFTLTDRDELLAVMIEPFRAARYDEALLDGMEFIRKRLNRNANAGGPAPESPPAQGPVPTTAPATVPAPTPPAPAVAAAGAPDSAPAASTPAPAPEVHPDRSGDTTPPTIHLPSPPDTGPADSARPVATKGPATDPSLRPVPGTPAVPRPTTAASVPATSPTTRPAQ